MKYWIYILTFIAISCNYHPEGKPGGDIIPENKLVDLLVEFHYIESVLTASPTLSGYTSRVDSVDFYQMLLDKYGITRPQFDATMNYYSYMPVKLEGIYNKVIDRLNRKLMELDIPEHVTGSE